MSAALDTIAAVATGFQAAGVGIVRLSGPEAAAIARRVAAALVEPAEPRRLYFGAIRDPDTGARIDEGFAVLFPAPRSFTGEDCAELQVHGGALNLSRVLGAVLAAGARAAEPGEFTRRAFLRGKLDLTRAEAILDVVHARTEGGLVAAQRQLRGDLAEDMDALRDALVAALARIELNIDFVHEDVPLYEHDAIAARLHAPRARIDALLATYDRGRVIRQGISVALAGPPNAGKSSLFNALLRERRAIVTEVPGTTRDFLEERVELAGVGVVLVDTAGLRDSDDAVERIGVERSHARIATADLVLGLADGSRARDPAAVAAIEALPAVRCLRVLNQCDRPEHPSWARAPGWAEALRVSALRGDGLEALVSALGARAGATPEGMADGAIITRARHFAALRRAREAIESATGALEAGLPSELAAGELRLALDALADVVGITTPDDVLDHIFGEFCIGK